MGAIRINVSIPEVCTYILNISYLFQVLILGCEDKKNFFKVYEQDSEEARCQTRTFI